MGPSMESGKVESYVSGTSSEMVTSVAYSTVYTSRLNVCNDGIVRSIKWERKTCWRDRDMVCAQE